MTLCVGIEAGQCSVSALYTC